MKMKSLLQFLIIFLSSSIMIACSSDKEMPDESPFSFSWDNATVYFVYVDRFLNADPSNDQNYNRKNDYGDETKNVATFHGGDILGLTQKLEDNYFQDLGINVIWVTGMYEQIHGWVGGGDNNDFPHYAYHGYYPMDFTAMDKNYGTIEEFRSFVDLAHANGIRVVMDAGINHPGYNTLLDAVQYDFGGVNLSEEKAREHNSGLNQVEEGEDRHYMIYQYLQHFDFDNEEAWEKWWGKAWVRGKDEVDKDVLTESIFGLPDFRTESTQVVGLPAILKNKWAKEGDAFKAWVNPSAQQYRKDLQIAQTDYVIKWTAAWVEEFGIDGFRCDVLENVDTFRWKQLNDECNTALKKWKEKHPEHEASKWDEKFWMTGDIWGAGIEYYDEYAQAGFNSIVNFKFPKDGKLDSIGYVWQEYADSLNNKDDWSTLSFLNNTYKRDTDFSNMKNCGISLVLAPGAVQIFYGDEVARPIAPNQASDPSHGYRGDYIWGQNPEMLKHWQKLGQFRFRHPAVGAGQQTMIDHNTFLRFYEQGALTDKVIIKLTDKNETEINVAEIFEDGTKLRDAYTGKTDLVVDQKVSFKPSNGVLLIERVD